MQLKVRRISGIKGRKNKIIKQSEQSVWERWLSFLKYLGIVVISIALMILVYFAEQNGIWFKASLLEAPQPFNGTVLPVAQVPDWEYWSTQKDLHFNQIEKSSLIDLPRYDLNQLQFPSDQLKWGDQSQNDIRNAKITYSVVYLGNYQFDHKENVGSHPAIDIKMPIGTPIHSIANGKVIKTSMQSNGFGHHIVIKHPNVPDPDQTGKLITIYSSYTHLDEIHVKEGQNVSKGEVIGTSGNTGTSTTPHLHFQIDRDSAPWHPYWPFSWQDSQAAGLSFFEAVNAGLGLEKGREHTIHPMKFVYQNLNANAIATNDKNATTPAPQEKEGESNEEIRNSNTVEFEENKAEEVIIGDVQPPAEVVKEISVKETNSSALFEFEIIGETIGLINNGVTLTVTDPSRQIEQLEKEDSVKVELDGVGSLLKKEFKKSDFSNQSVKVVVKSSEVGIANVTIGKSSHQIHFIDGIKPVHHLKVKHDGHFQKNIVETVEIIAMDEDGNVAPNVNFPGFVNISVEEGNAKVDPVQLQAHQFKAGIARIKVTSYDEARIRIKAQNGGLVGTSEVITMEDPQLFSDIKSNHRNYEAIKYLKEKNILSGYSDGTFKPNQVVNRVEALKMLMLAFNIQADSSQKINFADTEPHAWYIPTLSTAVEKGIVKGYADGTFKPANTVNRAEYLKILFNTSGVKTNIEITKPYDDVETNMWFSQYAFLANKMNLIDPASKLYPDRFITRAEVAETIYRMKIIQQHNLVTYSN